MIRAEALSRRGKRLLREALGGRSFDAAFRRGSPAVVVGVESRTSTPVRVPRDPATGMHPEVRGLFPTGEGAGYAGGIVSAALDGERMADAAADYVEHATMR